MPPKVLSDRLKRLTDAGYVERTIYSQHPLRAEYRLTDKGLSFFPVMKAIMEWGLGEFYAAEPDTQASIRKQVAAAARQYPQLKRKKGARIGA
jgi:DNA-binding HxlR family transcriptional regulator